MTKISKKEMEEILFTVDFDEPDDRFITTQDILNWAAWKFGGKGERIFKDIRGQKYSIVVAPIE